MEEMKNKTYISNIMAHWYFECIYLYLNILLFFVRNYIEFSSLRAAKFKSNSNIFW